MRGVRTVVVVAPAFPPHPTPAAQRVRLLSRFAESNGWALEVLTVAPDAYEEPLDWGLMQTIPAGTRITRVGALPVRLTRRFGIGNIALRSMWPIRRALRKLARTGRPDAIFLSGPPFFSAALLPGIKRRFGIPYVIDYTDPWVFEPLPAENHVYKKGFWADRIGAWLEPRIVRNAASILTVSDGTTESIRRRYPGVAAERFHAIPFGFERSEFEAAAGRASSHHRPVDDGCFHVAYLGAMPPRGFEVLRALFEAVVLLRRTHPIDAARLRMHFTGTLYDPRASTGVIGPVAREYALEDIVDEHFQRIPYADALTAMKSADGLLALGSTDRHYTASKIFPSLLAERPILAIFHAESNVCDILRATTAGELVTYDDEHRAESRVEEIAKALLRMIRGETKVCSELPSEVVDLYSAENLSRQVFQVLDAAVDAYHSIRSLRPDGPRIGTADQ